MKKSVFYTSFLLGTLFVFISLTLPLKDGDKNAVIDRYKVIKVNGDITYAKNGKKLNRGDEFAASTELDFDSPQSRAAVISSLKGRFVLKSNDSGEPNLMPAMNNMSSRAGALLNEIDLKNHFKDNYLVLGDMELKIGEKAFPLDNGNFFYVQYEYNREKIPKKLGKVADENKIIIDPEEIFKIDGQPVDANPSTMTLYYRKKDEKKSVKISEFHPVFPELSNLKSEVQIIIEEFAEKSNEVKIDEITAYLNEFYGKPDKDDLSAWLEKEFDLS